MGIKSTRTISRDTAISRIKEIDRLVAEQDFRGIEAITYDPECNLPQFVRTGAQYGDIEKWTNSMLADLMDHPFYRFSMFDNYFVTDTGEDEW